MLVVCPLSLLLVSGAVCQTVKVNSKQSSKREITYSGEIAGIIYQKCSSCHHDGEAAPFPLMSYEDARKRSETISAVVQAGYMPPWKPAREYGEFQACRALTQEQIASIKEWVEAGSPSGDLSKAPKPPVYNSDWRLGPPDLILSMDKPFTVPASGPDIYRCFVIPTGLMKNKYVSAVEFKPGNRRVVHHALFFLDNTGAARKKDAEDTEPGFQSFGGPGFIPTGGLGGWAPGNSQQPLPEGVARIIRSGADLVIQEHFHPTGKTEVEKSTIGIYFSKTTPKKLLLPVVVRSRGIDIPANETSHVVKASMEIPIDMQLINVTPHAHLLAKQITATATLPDGEKVPLIKIKNWDFNWQEQYTFAKPIKLPAGSRIDGEFVYDNSAGNPRNPNSPPKRVHWGEQTTDEMAILFFGAVAERQEEVPAYVRSMIRKNAPLILKSNPGQLLFAARQIFKPDQRFGKILPEEDDGQRSTATLKPADIEKAPDRGRGTEKTAGTNTTSRTGALSVELPSKGKLATALFFISTECPISNRYSPDIIKISNKYKDKGVECVGIYSDPVLTDREISEHAATYGYKFPVMHDKSSELRKRFGITKTPEVAVIDNQDQLIYRGRIDDRYVTFGTVRPSAKVHDLIDVLDAVADRKPMKPRFTEAVGCGMPK